MTYQQLLHMLKQMPGSKLDQQVFIADWTRKGRAMRSPKQFGAFRDPLGIEDVYAILMYESTGAARRVSETHVTWEE